MKINSYLQNNAWHNLPEMFKVRVKNLYNIPYPTLAHIVVFDTLEWLFGLSNVMEKEGERLGSQTQIDEELKDRAWATLPKKFKTKVVMLYNIPCQSNGLYYTLEHLFGGKTCPMMGIRQQDIL